MIPGADVTVTSRDGRTSTVKTDADGNFDAGVMAARVRVASEGFETATVEISGTGPVQVVLRPVNFADSVVVTATRGAERLPSAASSTVLTSAELSNMAAGALDDALRSTPGFTLVPPLVVARRQSDDAGRDAARRVGVGMRAARSCSPTACR